MHSFFEIEPLVLREKLRILGVPEHQPVFLDDVLFERVSLVAKELLPRCLLEGVSRELLSIQKHP